MRVLLVNAYANSGGASVAARRLCSALIEAGVDAQLLVQNMEGVRDDRLVQTHDRLARNRPLLDAIPALAWRNRRTPHWGNAWLGNKATSRVIRDFAPDVTHLHWVNHGMLSLRDVAGIEGPVIWTLHDSWVFTGGCHSPQDCRRYEQKCGLCPEIGSKVSHDLSRWNWQRKSRIWRDCRFEVITPSRWLADRASRSSLFKDRRIHVIPNAVDTEIFKPRNRLDARSELGLPLDKKLFLFAAYGALSDWNKGGDLWITALQRLHNLNPDAEAVLVGAQGVANLPVSRKVHSLGIVSGQQMALALNAANAVVVPSRMENLPNIVAESLSCGTPVAAFAVGGIPEMIQSGSNGYLAKAFDADDLVAGIHELLTDGDSMRDACLSSAATYQPSMVAKRHIDLYRRVTES